MNGEKKPEGIPSADFDNAKTAYQISLDLAIYQDGALWTKFNTLLVANGLILVFWSAIITANSTKNIVCLYSLLLFIFGIILNSLGCFWISRTVKYKEYHHDNACAIEKTYFNNNPVISNGKKKFDIAKSKFLGLNIFKYKLVNKIRSGTILISVFFIIAYVTLFILEIISLCHF